MSLTDLVDVVETLTTVEEITNTIVGNFEDYPNIQAGFKSYISDIERYDFDDFKQDVINMLNAINNFSEEEFGALNLALEDLGSWYFEEAVDAVNRDDYIYFPEVESDYDLGETYVKYVGSIEDAVGREDLPDYINVEEIAKSYYEDKEDEDVDLEDYISAVAIEVEEHPEDFLDFFDYEAFGSDLRVNDGWYIGNTGAIWTQ